MAMPITTRPHAIRGSWPGYAQEAVDYFAATIDNTAFLELEADRNRVRLVPSGIEIERMEAAISWPAHYLHDRPILARLVQEVAMGRARGLSIERIARGLRPKRTRRSPTFVRACNRAGLDLIAAGLRRDDVAVF
jgi:hypothetical protein